MNQSTRLRATVRTIVLALGTLALMGQSTPTADYTYDALGRLSSVTYYLKASGTPTTITYTYDNAGNRTAQTVNGIPATCSPGMWSQPYDTLYTTTLRCSEPGKVPLSITSISLSPNTNCPEDSVTATGLSIKLKVSSACNYFTRSLSYTLTDSAGNATAMTATVTPDTLSCGLSWGSQGWTVQETQSISCTDTGGNSYHVTSISGLNPPSSVNITFSGTQITVTNPGNAYFGYFSFSFSVADSLGVTTTASVTGAEIY